MEPTGVDVERLEMGAQQNHGKVEPRAGRVHLVSHPHNSAQLPCFRQVPSVKCVERVQDVSVACTCGIYFPSRSILVAYSQNTPCNISACTVYTPSGYQWPVRSCNHICTCISSVPWQEECYRDAETTPTTCGLVYEITQLRHADDDIKRRRIR